jgi:hypothetical protein
VQVSHEDSHNVQFGGASRVKGRYPGREAMSKLENESLAKGDLTEIRLTSESLLTQNSRMW